MQYSLINFEDMEAQSFRFDPEFYHPSHLKMEKELTAKEHYRLTELCNLYDGPFGSNFLSENYSSEGVPMLRMQNVTKTGLLDLSAVEYVPYDEAERLQKYTIYPGEVAVTKVGFLGYATVLTNDFDSYIFRREITRLKVVRDDLVNPYYIATFFNSVYGRTQSKRYSSGTTRDRVLLTSQREIIVPVLSNNIQGLIERICRKAYELNAESIKLFKEAEDYLLSQLGLKEKKYQHQLSFEVDSSTVFDSGRFDAEYYQPKYEELIDHIKQNPNSWAKLTDLVTVRDGNYEPLDHETYKYIELANINVIGEITGCTEAQGYELPTRARRLVFADDVIVSSIEGSLSSCAIIDHEYDYALCSTGFFVFKSDSYFPEVLLCIMKSIIGQMQLKKGCSGTILTAINKKELSNIVLPVLSIQQQNEIKRRINSVYHLKSRVKKLLDIAKTIVEISVKEDEEKAVTWLQKQKELKDI